MIILSKANLVDEGIDLDEIKNSIKRDSIVMGENNGDGFSNLLGDLQEKHKTIKQVSIIFTTIWHNHLFHRIIQQPSPTFVKPSLIN